VVFSGYDNGDVIMYDLRTNTLRWQSNIGDGVCSLQVSFSFSLSLSLSLSLFVSIISILMRRYMFTHARSRVCVFVLFLSSQVPDKYTPLSSLIATSKSLVSSFSEENLRNSGARPQFSSTQQPDGITIWSSRYVTRDCLMTTNQKGEVHLYSDTLHLIHKESLSSQPILSIGVTPTLPGEWSYFCVRVCV